MGTNFETPCTVKLMILILQTPLYWGGIWIIIFFYFLLKVPSKFSVDSFNVRGMDVGSMVHVTDSKTRQRRIVWLAVERGLGENNNRLLFVQQFP